MKVGKALCLTHYRCLAFLPVLQVTGMGSSFHRSSCIDLLCAAPLAALWTPLSCAGKNYLVFWKGILQKNRKFTCKVGEGAFLSWCAPYSVSKYWKKKDQSQTKRKPQEQKPSSVNFKIKLEKLERQMKMLVVHFQCAQRNLPLMPALICQEPRRSMHLCKLSAYLSSCTMTLWVILYASGLVFTWVDCALFSWVSESE